MNEKEILVAVISPWEKLRELAKNNFRVESLPAEKKVMVWRDDLQDEQALSAALEQAGIASVELRRGSVTNWKSVD